MRSRRRVVLAIALGLGTVAGPAHADGFDDWESGLRGGMPALTPLAAYMGRDVEVFRCPGGGSCETAPLPQVGSGYGSFLDTSAAVAGDVFEARWSTADGVVHTARTPVWQGSPTATRPPSLKGRLAVGETLTLVPARWTGGWGWPWTASITYEVIVCRTKAGSDCFILNELPPWVLEARWEGWYAFAVSGFTSGYTSAVSVQGPPRVDPFPVPRIYRGATAVDSGPIGRIAAAPTASLREHPFRDHGRLRIGRVTCPAGCRATVTVASRGHKTLRRTWTVAGTEALTIPPTRGRLTVRVDVDGKRLARATSVWRR